ncbi:hypothetical protein PFISCL1PPCAC_11023 [Pristionchus fissidentatus]|uniref:Major facilitator superfamily (MFS) profile domain-containing protein n=1 Tax=Pristionchus fissidentatus TaxID=1538716 RepID=A0AAV5VJD2_9BILA|nr:hypothetical protein PFISCL1PPCAC_11023 [Pristionchus fissidentatus]
MAIRMPFQINRFHLLVLFTWQFTIFFASQQIFGIFSNYVPEWKCGDGEPGKNCTEYKRCDGDITWVNPVFNSAAMEYKWICDGDYYMSLFNQLQFGGVLIGTITFGTASDRFGRKPIAIAALTLGVTALFGASYVSNMIALFVFRFFVGLAIGGALVVVCTFVMEMLLPQQRMALRAFFNWGVARLMITVICWQALEWRVATAACAALSIPAILILIFVFPESPTWLHTKGRLDEMRESEKAIARRGGMEYVPVKHRKIERNKTFMELIKGGLFRRLVTLWIMWFVASLTGYATDFNSGHLSGDLYANQAIFSILIAVSKMVLVLVDTFVPGFSRRVLHQGSQLGAVVCFGIAGVFKFLDYQGDWFLIVNTIGTVFIEYTWDACYLCAVESMETSSRASATGSCSLVARIGAIIAPSLNYVNQHYGGLVYIIVVALGTINLIQSYFFLVETKGIVLDNVKVDDDDVTLDDEEMTELENGGNGEKR